MPEFEYKLIIKAESRELADQKAHFIGELNDVSIRSIDVIESSSLKAPGMIIDPRILKPSIGEAVKAAAEKLGMSINELSRKAGIHRMTIYRLYNGKQYQVSSDKLTRLARVLGTTEEYLLTAWLTMLVKNSQTSEFPEM